ncbi:MAG: arginine--tRNA ligase [Flavobacteriales bacterium]|nr:arginine--tRNA ligase [Flavobacteriales bacterium]
MSIKERIEECVVKQLNELYDLEVSRERVVAQKTNPVFEGDLTIVVFSFVKQLKKSPVEIGEQLGDALVGNMKEISSYNVEKGFLNLVVGNEYWLEAYNEIDSSVDYGFVKATKEAESVMIEFSSPNTNKPLHLGHVRNNLLGHSVAEILKASGRNVIKVNLVNDRGIHICKSMIAWQRWGEGATPELEKKKGDKLVGDYYVRFDQEYKKEVADAVASGKDKEVAEKESELMESAKEMLRKWEDGEEETILLWEKMNGWVYDGFKQTYARMGIGFDKVYYESETYLLGKEIVEKGLKDNVLYKKEDGSVWCSLEQDKMDDKLLLRSDGTSVYMTQDLGTAVQRFGDYTLNNMLYVVGNEQDYHFRVLFNVLGKLGYRWSEGMAHLSYGMVDLPSGKMKSREGTVVDADDLMEEMVNTARATTEELGKVDSFSNEEAAELYEMIGMSALKYFILKVDPQKKMMFDPKESIDFNGNTGPFIQYTHARICSILEKSKISQDDVMYIQIEPSQLHVKEKELIKRLVDYPEVIQEGASNYSPAIIANYIYSLARDYNQFYQEVSILKEKDDLLLKFRVSLSYSVSQTINSGMLLLGVEVPRKM